MTQALSGEAGIGRLEVSRAVPRDPSSVPGDVTHLIVAQSMSRAAVADLLEERPDLSVVLITADAVDAAVLELWPRRRELGELSPDRLRSAVRQTTGWSDRFAPRAGGGQAGRPA